MRMIMRIAAGAALALTFFSAPARADVRIAVLDFELVDLTLLPRPPEEVERAASLKALLEKSLIARGGYRIAAADPTARSFEARSVGYLWNHPEEAAGLAQPGEADYVLVGMVAKPSFLFEYFKARLVDVRTGKMVGEWAVEIKGQLGRLPPRGIENLARQIDADLAVLRKSVVAALPRSGRQAATRMD